MIAQEVLDITDLVAEDLPEEAATPGLTHLWLLTVIDRTGLSHWLLGFGFFLVQTIIAFFILILERYPDPAMYQNGVAFSAISGFFLAFYFGMGRGWYRDMLEFVRFDQSLVPLTTLVEPSRIVTILELIVAAFCVYVNISINDNIEWDYSTVLTVTLVIFYGIQWVMIILCIDIVLRQLIALMKMVKKIRIDLLSADFYSNLANVMVRHVGLCISGICIVSLSYITFTDGELTAGEMMVLMMPWYLPGLFIISLYIIPYNLFRKRMRSAKAQELSSVAAALNGNAGALEQTLLAGEEHPSKIDLLYYRDLIDAIKEWPFTDRIRALVLFGILPPLTWVIAALIEIFIEGAL